MLAQRLRRWPNIKPAPSERLVFAWMVIVHGAHQVLYASDHHVYHDQMMAWL